MHEMSLMADLFRKIESVARAEGAARVRRVSVWIGALAHISASHFADHFRDGARGTRFEGAALDVQESTDDADPHAGDIRLLEIEVDTE